MVSESPTGSEPAIDQEYGVTPPVVVQMAVYMIPKTAGPADGVQSRVNGAGAAVPTVRLAKPDAGPSDALIVVVPEETPVNFPDGVMVAMPGPDDVQRT